MRLHRRCPITFGLLRNRIPCRLDRFGERGIHYILPGLAGITMRGNRYACAMDKAIWEGLSQGNMDETTAVFVWWNCLRKKMLRLIKACLYLISWWRQNNSCPLPAIYSSYFVKQGSVFVQETRNALRSTKVMNHNRGRIYRRFVPLKIHQNIVH